MKYFGGKVRLGLQLADIINEIRLADSYHEPFCGMYSVGRHIKTRERSGADAHPDLVLLLKAVQDGWVGPQNISEFTYNICKKSSPSALRAFVGFGCSFGGKFFGGYARDRTKRNYAKNASRSLKKLSSTLRGVHFYQQDYLAYMGGADIIYCDPPYRGTTGFSHGKFDSNTFWEWVRGLSKRAIVLVSEYEAPDDFEVVWQKPVKTDMNSKTGQKLSRIESLFKKK